jgi:hypothetical protein
MKKILKIIGIVFLIIIVIGVISGNGNKTISPNKEGQKKEIANEKTKETVKVEIASFMQEFDENQLAAEKKYKDKIVELSGYIKNISEDIGGSPYISLDKTLETTFNLTQVKCVFKSANDVMGLKNGQKVAVKGEFISQVAGIIELKNCQLVQE